MGDFENGTTGGTSVLHIAEHTFRVRGAEQITCQTTIALRSREAHRNLQDLFQRVPAYVMRERRCCVLLFYVSLPPLMGNAAWYEKLNRLQYLLLVGYFRN